MHPAARVRLGLGGDKTENVLWRIDHGELAGLSPKLVVLLIGTNNLAGDDTTPSMAAKGIATVVSAIRAKLPATRLLLLGILPREEQPSDALRASIARGENENVIKELGRKNGMRTLYQDALDKARAGVTSLKEALATTRPDE